MPLTFPTFPDGMVPWGDKFRQFLATLAKIPERDGVVTVTGAAARDALPDPLDGQRAYLSDLNRLDVFDGEEWRPFAGALPTFETVGTVTQGLPAGTVALLEKWTNPQVTPDSFVGWNGSALVIKHPGVYALSGTLSVLDGGETSILFSITTGSGAAATERAFFSDGSGAIALPAIRLKAGDLVGLGVYSQAGGRTNPARQSLAVAYLHP
jgi:hypothetical protein